MGVTATASDSQGGPVTYGWTASCPAALSGSGTFTPSAAGQAPTWTAPANLTGTLQTCTLTVTATNGQGRSATASYGQGVNAAANTVTITAGPTGTPNPVGSSGTSALTVTATDVLGRPLTYAWSAACPAALGGAGTFAPSATERTPTWTAPANTTASVQTCTLTVVVNDGAGATATRTYGQGVTAAAALPTVTITSGPTGTPNPVGSGGPAALVVAATHSTGAALTYTWSAVCPAALGGSGSFAPSATGQTPTWTAPANGTGSVQGCTLTVVASDGQGTSATASYTQNVGAAAHTLTITVPPSGTPNPSAPGQGVALNVVAVDSLGHSLTHLWQATCAEVSGTGTFMPNASAATPAWTPPASPPGGTLSCLLRVTINDGAGQSASASFVQRVEPGGGVTEHTLTITTSPAGTPNPAVAGTAVSVTVTAVDSLDHPLTYQWTAGCPTLAGAGTFSPSPIGQTVSWTAPTNATGTLQACTLRVTVDDGQGETVSASYVQGVSSVPHQLTITAGPGGTPNPVDPGGSVAVSVTAVDTLDHPLSYLWQATCAGVATGGTFSPNATQANVTWKPPVHPAGDAFSCLLRVSILDGQGQSVDASYTQQVSATSAQSSRTEGEALEVAVPTLRATVGDRVVYLAWGQPLAADRAWLQVLRALEGAAPEPLGSIAIDPQAQGARLTHLPDGTRLANGERYRIGLVVERSSVVRPPRPSEFVVVKPGELGLAYPAGRPALFLPGYAGRGDAFGAFGDTLDFAGSTLKWQFGGRLCLTDLGPEPKADGCDSLEGKAGASADYFTLDFGSAVAEYGAPEVAAVLGHLSKAGVIEPITLVGHGTGVVAARRYLARTENADGRVAGLVVLAADADAGNNPAAVFCALTTQCLTVRSASPVELSVTSPDGRVVARGVSEIPGAAFTAQAGPEAVVTGTLCDARRLRDHGGWAGGRGCGNASDDRGRAGRARHRARERRPAQGGPGRGVCGDGEVAQDGHRYSVVGHRLSVLVTPFRRAGV